jgi:glycosyltransferase involved in cell wall biosynthesis
MNTLSTVSIVIPCRNEEKFIGKCLDSVIASDFPKNNLEVLVVDGMSNDGTRELIIRYSQKYPFIKLLNNNRKITPVAMNVGIKESIGNYIIILSSHSKIDKNFLRTNIENIKKSTVGCVGGILVTHPANNAHLSKTIAMALSHPFGVGNSYFRIGLKEPRYVDTVPFGCYKREVFDNIGLFDEDLVRNQDDELNLRLIKTGGKILLIPDIVSFYHARDSLSKLWKMYYQYGYFKPLVVQKIGTVLTWRQLIPTFFVSSLVTSGILSLIIQPIILVFFLIISLYLLANVTFSFSLAKNKGLKFFVTLPIVFATLHLSYGTGYLKGIWVFILLKKHKKRKIEDIPLTR